MRKLLDLSEDGAKMLNKAVFAAVLSNLALLLSFGVALQVITALLSPVLSGGALNVTALWQLTAAAFVAALLYFIAYKNEYRKTYVASYREAEKIRVEVAEHLRRLPLSFFNRKDLTELTTNIMGDCASIEHTLSHVLPELAANIITIVVSALALSFFDWRMALALFAPLPVAVALVVFPKRLQAKFGERHVSAKLDAAERMQEYFEGIKVVKAFGLAGEKFEALKTSFKTMMRQSIKFEVVTGVFVVSTMMILQAGIGLVTFTGVTLLAAGAIDPVKTLFFILISARIYAPVILIMTMLPELFYLLISTRRMQALRKEPLMTGADNVSFPDFNIALKDVSFAYGGDEVLQNVSFTIPQGGVTALVGPSGSGKSTITRLVARFWDVTRGEISVGGVAINTVEPETLMRSMSFVFQDVTLFNDTVMNNIRIGKKDAADSEVYAAAKAARCDEFIRAMPRGYDTLIGENGCTLSGGERQRISIARALLKDAPVVLLDEATASLDPENETLVQEAISMLVAGRPGAPPRTVIVIAHRLRTVLGADKIVVLDKGRVVEEGTGAALLARGGLFARLYAAQQESAGWTVEATV